MVRIGTLCENLPSSLTLSLHLESSEGLARKLTLNYYSRTRFISNLLPLLQTATTTAPHFSRTLSILGAGHEDKINFDDLELNNIFTAGRCAAHSIVMNDFMAEEFSQRQPATTFIHSSPGIVNTNIIRELPIWARIITRAATPLLSLFMVSAEETGARQLFIATSGLYPPAKPFENSPLASGVAPPKGLTPMPGGNGVVGSGAYLINWNNEVTGKQTLLAEYRENGAGKTIWEHTMGIFQRVEKVNRERAA